MTTGTRYRVEGGRTWIDLKVGQSRQLFDGRDPAPFRERDLDEDAVDYLLTAVEEIPRTQSPAIAITITDEPEPAVSSDSIVAAVRSHFAYELAQTERRFRDHIRRGQISLAVGLTMLFVFLAIAELMLSFQPGPLRDILREGFVITGWVAMWRPLEILLYDWLPIVDARREIRRILDAPLSVHYDSGEPGGQHRQVN